MEKIEDYKINVERFVDSLKTTDRTAAKAPETNQERLGISQEVLDRYYKTALEFLAEKNWHDAEDAFFFLTFLTPLNHNFWVGLGVAQQSQAEYEPALMSYMMAQATNPNDPIPLANAYQCSFAVGDKNMAQSYLHQAIEKCGDNPEFTELKGKLSQISVGT